MSVMLPAIRSRHILLRVCQVVASQRCLLSKPGDAPVDPIQQSFIARLREYRQKSEKSECQLADATSKEIKELSEMLAKVDRIYGAEGQDMTQFPTFQFEDPKVVIPASSLQVDYPKDPENTV
ncbi:unnamed protein product [Schistosoma turkestanicum]|nr:unnamed protein product [Schistosoma turkestanicum]